MEFSINISSYYINNMIIDYFQRNNLTGKNCLGNLRCGTASFKLLTNVEGFTKHRIIEVKNRNISFRYLNIEKLKLYIIIANVIIKR